MAKYDRDFLVPYLEDICTLQLSKKKLEKMISTAKQEISNINYEALSKVDKPQYEQYKGDRDLTGVGMILLGCFLLLFSLILFFASFGAKTPLAMLFPFLVGGVGIYIEFRGLTAKSRENDEIQIRNEQKEKDHNIAEMAALVLAEPKVNAVKSRINQYKAEIDHVDTLLNTLYNINIIPSWYRDLYPAVYLYDWFSNSRADDLDLALNTLVLEQIKDRLDTIIINQGEMIINQRIMMANQEKAMEQNSRHHQMLMDKLDKIEASNEDRKMYLRMIEGNTAANAYFSAAAYLKY